MAAKGDECSMIARAEVSNCNWTGVDSEVIQLGEVESSQVNERRPIPMPFFSSLSTRMKPGKDASKTLYAKCKCQIKFDRHNVCPVCPRPPRPKTTSSRQTQSTMTFSQIRFPIPSDLRSLNTSKGTLTATCGESGIFRGAGVVGV